jgi:carbon-monoxide dehydrogenase medium subunit
VERDGGTCMSCRIAMGAVAETPIRIPSAESGLSGRAIDDRLLDEAATVLSDGIQPLTDVRSTELYRKQVSRILFKDTFTKAWNRATQEK